MTTAQTAPRVEHADGKPLDFTETEQCKRFVFCKTCRDTGSVGKLWRRVVAKRFDMQEVDWKCPHGWRWGGKPGLVLSIKQKLGLGTRFKQTTASAGIRPCGGCARRAARMDGRQA